MDNQITTQQIQQHKAQQKLKTCLCVDLDGTLVKTDTLVECIIAILRQRPLSLLRLPIYLLKGRAFLKQQIAARVNLNPGLLPYRQELIEYLLQEKNFGRRIVLATAATRCIADGIAAHLNLFDEVLASDDTCNLKGTQKARVLTEKYGKEGFSYAGNDRHDIPIWIAAKSAITVDTTVKVRRQIPGSTVLERDFPDERKRVKALIRSMRPHHWVKNLLVFVPILTSGVFGELNAWINAGLVFAAFSLTASGLYIFNDILDLESDRSHPTKRRRPFASGTLPLLLGLGLAPVLVAAGLALAAASQGLLFLLAYASASFLYSLRLKLLPLVDVFILASLYSLRLFAGGSVTGHPVSFWLIGFSSFFFLNLAIIKRVAELMKTERLVRGYLPQDRHVLQTIGIGAGFVSSNLLALYVQNDAVAQEHHNSKVLYALIPLILFFQCRLWLSTARGYMQDDPIIYAAKDWVSWLVALGLVMTLVASFASF